MFIIASRRKRSYLSLAELTTCIDRGWRNHGVGYAIRRSARWNEGGYRHRRQDQVGGIDIDNDEATSTSSIDCIINNNILNIIIITAIVYIVGTVIFNICMAIFVESSAMQVSS